jgi:hypothetical protein
LPERCKNGNLYVAEAPARELGRISLARWLERYLQECQPNLSDVGLVASALAALPESQGVEAVRVLRRLLGSF